MKKIYLLLVMFVTVIFISGCNNKNNVKELTCSGLSKGNNMNLYAEVKYKFKNDKLIESRMDATFKDITVDNLKEVWDSFKKQFNEQNLPVQEEGFKRTTKSDDKNYTFTVSIVVDFEKISKETMKKYDIQDYTNSTYDEIKKEIESDNNFICK